jgi:hypothetical protein
MKGKVHKQVEFLSSYESIIVCSTPQSYWKYLINGNHEQNITIPQETISFMNVKPF